MKNVVCKKIRYDYENHADYPAIMEVAAEWLEKDYEKKREEEERTDPKVREYALPFSVFKNSSAYGEALKNITENFMKNYLGLPSETILSVNEDFTDVTLRKQIWEKYGIEPQKMKWDYANMENILSFKKEKTISGLLGDGKYEEFLHFVSNLDGNYSFNNLALIYTQKPDATVLRSLNAWQKEGRKIINPIRTGIFYFRVRQEILKNEKDVDNFVNRYKDKYNWDEKTCKDKKEEAMSEIMRFGYKEKRYGCYTDTFYDVSDTEPIGRLREKKVVNRAEPKVGRHFENYGDVCFILDCVYGNDRPSLNNTLPKSERLYTQISRYCGKMLSLHPDTIDGINGHITYDGIIHKLETITSAYFICRHLGIECEERVSFAIEKTLEEMDHRISIDNELITFGAKTMFETAYFRGRKMSDQFIREYTIAEKNMDYERKNEDKERAYIAAERG